MFAISLVANISFFVGVNPDRRHCDVKIRRVIPSGGETRVIDLPGANRNIKKVMFWYESTERNNKRATVRLWGRK